MAIILDYTVVIIQFYYEETEKSNLSVCDLVLNELLFYIVLLFKEPECQELYLSKKLRWTQVFYNDSKKLRIAFQMLVITNYRFLIILGF